MAGADPIPLRPATVGALLEAAEASGLSDEAIGRLILRWFPESLTVAYPPSMPMIRRAAGIGQADRRLLRAVREVGDE